MDDIPVLKKCCYCVPLRYGLLTWGYMKLALALTAGSFYIVILTALAPFFRGDHLLNTLIALIGMLIAAEIIIHIVFIIGAHKKKVKLLKVYYYYAIFMWVAIVLISIVGTVILALTIRGRRSADKELTIILVSSCFSIIFALTVQSFLLVSIRSEIIKLRSNCPYRFVKNDNEPEGAINPVKEEMAIDDGTVHIL